MDGRLVTGECCGWTLKVRRDPSDIATARIVDGRRVAAGRLAADDPVTAIVVRNRPGAVGRRPGDDLAGSVVERPRLRRRCAGHHRECEHCTWPWAHAVLERIKK
jgi:hypothetical protein